MPKRRRSRKGSVGYRAKQTARSASVKPSEPRTPFKDKTNERQQRHREATAESGGRSTVISKEALQKRLRRAIQRADANGARADEAEAKAEAAQAEAERLEQKLAAAERKAEQAIIELWKAETDLHKALNELEQLEEQLADEQQRHDSAGSARDAALDLKRRDGSYKTEFQLMCTRIVMDGVPQKRASSVIRAVLEYVYDKELPDLKLPSRATYRNVVTAGKVLAEAVAAKVVAESKAALAQTIDYTTKLGQGFHSSTLQAGKTSLSLGVRQSPTKSAADQFAINEQMLGDVERSGEAVLDVPRGQILRQVEVLVSDKGSSEAKMHKLLEEKKQQLARADGASVAKAKRLAAVEKIECNKHLLGNICEDLLRKALCKTDVPKEKRATQLEWTVAKFFRAKARHGHQVGAKFDTFCKLRRRPNDTKGVLKSTNTRIYMRLRSMIAIRLAMGLMQEFTKTGAPKAKRRDAEMKGTLILLLHLSEPSPGVMKVNRGLRSIASTLDDDEALGQLDLLGGLNQLIFDVLERAATCRVFGVKCVADMAEIWKLLQEGLMDMIQDPRPYLLNAKSIFPGFTVARPPNERNFRKKGVAWLMWSMSNETIIEFIIGTKEKRASLRQEVSEERDELEALAESKRLSKTKKARAAALERRKSEVEAAFSSVEAAFHVVRTSKRQFDVDPAIRFAFESRPTIDERVKQCSVVLPMLLDSVEKRAADYITVDGVEGKWVNLPAAQRKKLRYVKPSSDSVERNFAIFDRTKTWYPNQTTESADARLKWTAQRPDKFFDCRKKLLEAFRRSREQVKKKQRLEKQRRLQLQQAQEEKMADVVEKGERAETKAIMEEKDVENEDAAQTVEHLHDMLLDLPAHLVQQILERQYKILRVKHGVSRKQLSMYDGFGDKLSTDELLKRLERFLKSNAKDVFSDHKARKPGRPKKSVAAQLEKKSKKKPPNDDDDWTERKERKQRAAASASAGPKPKPKDDEIDTTEDDDGRCEVTEV